MGKKGTRCGKEMKKKEKEEGEREEGEGKSKRVGLVLR